MFIFLWFFFFIVNESIGIGLKMVIICFFGCFFFWFFIVIGGVVDLVVGVFFGEISVLKILFLSLKVLVWILCLIGFGVLFVGWVICGSFILLVDVVDKIGFFLLLVVVAFVELISFLRLVVWLGFVEILVDSECFIVFFFVIGFFDNVVEVVDFGFDVEGYRVMIIIVSVMANNLDCYY